MTDKPTISLCMIVKNEERYLRDCLNSVKDIVDEMIIVDTGSTDKTIDIAKEFDTKIIYYKWKDDFADARNVSLSYAKMDWILIMDGDDVFNAEDKEKFKVLVNNDEGKYDLFFFNTASISGNEENNEVINNINIRLIRNHKGYEFKGAIHEQISNDNEIPRSELVKYEDIIVYHYGYMYEVVVEKEKRKRNISILEKEIKKEPNNIFNISNLGNEYYCLGDFKKALELYDVAYEKLEPARGYSSRVVMRRIESLIRLGEYNKALKAIDEGGKLYPKFTDLIYDKADIYKRQGKYTLAIDSLENCLENGESPMGLSFLVGSGSFKAYEQLGEIYIKLKDYDRAIKYYNKAREIKPNKKEYLIDIILTLIKKKREYNDFNIVENLGEVDSKYREDILSIFLDYGCLSEYDKIIKSVSEEELKTRKYLFLKARRLFYDKKYFEAMGYLSYLEESEYKKFEVAKYKTLIFLFNSPELVINYINKTKIEEMDKEILMKCYKIVYKVECNDFDAKYDKSKLLREIISVLREVLLLKEFDIFEKLLGVLNYIINDGILIALSKLYYDLGYEKMAAQEVVRSIKKFNIIDIDCIDILKSGL